MSGNLPEVMEVSGNKSCQSKLFIADYKFGTTPVFTRLLHAALCWLKDFAFLLSHPRHLYRICAHIYIVLVALTVTQRE